MKLSALSLFGLVVLAPLLSSHAGENRSPLRLAVPDEPWALPSSYVAAEVMEERLGLSVKIVELPASAGPGGVAGGGWDVLVAARLPDTHSGLREHGRLLDLGRNLQDLRFGMVVPEQSSIRSISELNEWAAELNFEVLGRHEEEELMRRANRAADSYHIDFTIAPKSAREWDKAWREREPGGGWIVGIASTPGWEWAKFDLRFLDDRQEAFGAPESLRNLIREDIASEHEELAGFLRRFQWTQEAANEVSLAIHTGTEPRQAAREWLRANQERVSEWLPEDLR